MQQKIKHKYVLLSVDLFRFLHDYSVKPRLIAVWSYKYIQIKTNAFT